MEKLINKGKQAVTYQATLPDGTVLKKKSFNIKDDVALIAAIKLNGEWFATGVTDRVRDWGSQQFFRASRLS
jgi:hypothetical protein